MLGICSAIGIIADSGLYLLIASMAADFTGGHESLISAVMSAATLSGVDQAFNALAASVRSCRGNIIVEHRRFERLGDLGIRLRRPFLRKQFQTAADASGVSRCQVGKRGFDIGVVQGLLFPFWRPALSFAIFATSASSSSRYLMCSGVSSVLFTSRTMTRMSKARLVGSPRSMSNVSLPSPVASNRGLPSTTAAVVSS